MSLYASRFHLVVFMLFFAPTILGIFFWACPAPASAAAVTLTWDEPATTDRIDGYKIYYGPASRTYDRSLLAQERNRCTVSDDFAEGATYYFAVTSYNAHGEESPYSAEVHITIPMTNPADAALPAEPVFPVLEAGEVQLNHSWLWVPFSRKFSDPVVVAKMTSANGSQPATVRIRNVTADGFEIRIQEWDYLDGWHVMETVDYLAMECGTYRLADGAMVAAGKFASLTSTMSGTQYFSQPFNTEPVLVATVESFAETDAVAVRFKNITTAGFDFRLQEQESNTQYHVSEDIAYIAWEPSSGIIDGVIYEVGLTRTALNHEWHTLVFNEDFTQPPFLLADMQTTNGTNTSTLRHRNKDNFSIDVQVQEEASLDEETWHVGETIGYLGLAVE
jgi:hypothetical protein